MKARTFSNLDGGHHSMQPQNRASIMVKENDENSQDVKLPQIKQITNKTNTDLPGHAAAIRTTPLTTNSDVNNEGGQKSSYDGEISLRDRANSQMQSFSKRNSRNDMNINSLAQT